MAMIVVIAVCGCNSPEPPKSETDRTKITNRSPSAKEGEDAPVPDASTPDGALALRLMEGFLHIDAALELLETARRSGTDQMEAHTGSGEAKEAWLGYLDAVDSVGSQLADLGVAPSEQDVRADFAAADDLRLKAIDETNIARFELEEAIANANVVLGRENEGMFADAISAAHRLEKAIEALGGEVRNPG